MASIATAIRSTSPPGCRMPTNSTGPICVGLAANLESRRKLGPLGEYKIGGFGTMELFTPDDYVGEG